MKNIECLFCYDGLEKPWEEELARVAPNLKLLHWPDWHEAHEPAYAIVWQPPAGQLARFSTLKAIFSLGAGVDHLSSDPALPKHLPLVRMVDETLTNGMVEYVVWAVLDSHRMMARYRRQRAQTKWKAHLQIMPQNRIVGVMGAGVLGRAVLEALLPFGFELRAYSQSPKNINGVNHFQGIGELSAFLHNCDVLVNLLPNTADTHGMIDMALMQELRKGAWIINPGRGQQLVDDDLILAIERKQISGAVLDVFHKEPLPHDHVFWRTPEIEITPHVAAMSLPATAASYIVEQIKQYEAGKPLANQVNWQRGY